VALCLLAAEQRCRAFGNARHRRANGLGGLADHRAACRWCLRSRYLGMCLRRSGASLAETGFLLFGLGLGWLDTLDLRGTSVRPAFGFWGGLPRHSRSPSLKSRNETPNFRNPFRFRSSISRESGFSRHAVAPVVCACLLSRNRYTLSRDTPSCEVVNRRLPKSLALSAMAVPLTCLMS
jgi:hypothetical protein